MLVVSTTSASGAKRLSWERRVAATCPQAEFNRGETAFPQLKQPVIIEKF